MLLDSTTTRLATLAGMMLVAEGCLSNHCDVYPDHCLVADDDSFSSSSSDTGADGTGADVTSGGSESETIGSETTGSAEIPDVPVLVAASSPVKQIEFSWSSVSGADVYRLLERRSIEGDFVQVGGDTMSTSMTVTVPIHRYANASYKLHACNVNGCSESDVVEVTDLAAAIGYFKASNPDLFDYFGSAIALSADGGTLVVGAPEEMSGASGIDGDESDDSAPLAGAIYVYVRNEDSTWSRQAYIKASNAGQGDQFGASVAISADGNTLAVGAHGEASGDAGVNAGQDDESAPSAGAVYVFERAEGIWSQQAYIKSSNVSSDDNFGYSIALSDDGDTLAVGAYGEVNAAGAAYVFMRNGIQWSQETRIVASNAGQNDAFGTRLALSGDGSTLAVSAVGEASAVAGINGVQSDNSAYEAGAVYVFIRSGQNWTQQAYVKAFNVTAGDYFGWRVDLSMDGNTLVATAPYEDGSAEGIDGPADDSAMDAGAVYVFSRVGSTWNSSTYIKASNAASGDLFGWSVGLSDDGDLVAIGAPEEDGASTGLHGDRDDDSLEQSGAGYMFYRSNGSWLQESYLKAPNSDLGDSFGSSVSLSGDGNTLAIGATGEASHATDVAGDQSDDSLPGAGAVYLF